MASKALPARKAPPKRPGGHGDRLAPCPFGGRRERCFGAWLAFMVAPMMTGAPLAVSVRWFDERTLEFVYVGEYLDGLR